MNTRSRIALLAGLAILAGCAPDVTETDFYSMHPDDAGAPTTIEIARFSDQGVEIVLEAETPLADGPNRILVSFEADGTVEGHARLTPVFVTAGGRLPSPFEPGETDGDDEAAAVVLLTPLGTQGTWTLDIDWEAAGRQGSRTVDVISAPSNRVRHDATREVYATWLSPSDPRVGDDDVTFALHRLSGLTWIPVPDAVLDLYPYMDMGGGEGHSTPYDAPAHVSEAIYTGRINFIMSGGWDLTLLVTLGSGSPVSLHFDDFTVR